MKLNNAYICVECDEIQSVDDYDKDMSMVSCKACGSNKVVPLGQWLYRNRSDISYKKSSQSYVKADYSEPMTTRKFR